MKNIIYKFLILLLIITNYSYSQNKPVLREITVSSVQSSSYTPKSGDYIKDVTNHLDRYVGTWKYQSSTTIFTLQLDKVNKYLIAPGESYLYTDLIIATYKLVKNGITVYDNLGSTVFNGQQDLRGKLSNSNSFDFINGVMRDFTTNVSIGRCEIKLLTPYPPQAGAQQKIFFKMFENHTKRMNEGEGNTTALFSMPNEIELIKQP